MSQVLSFEKVIMHQNLKKKGLEICLLFFEALLLFVINNETVTVNELENWFKEIEKTRSSRKVRRVLFLL